MSDTFSPDEMRKVAEHVYPDKGCHIGPDGVEIYDFFLFIFNPKLDGTDREKSQALDCIVEATKLPGTLALHKYETTKGTYYQFIRNRDAELSLEDPLSASISAILSHIGVKHER